MPDDLDLELPATIHIMQVRALSCATQLDAKLAAAPNSTHIEIRSEAASNLALLLRAQNQLLTKLYEENAAIRDLIDAAVRKNSQQ